MVKLEPGSEVSRKALKIVQHWMNGILTRDELAAELAMLYEEAQAS